MERNGKMRILIDTNILFSALVFPSSKPAIVSDVDIILTGDKDFFSLDMEHPKCMTVAQFFESEGVEE